MEAAQGPKYDQLILLLYANKDGVASIQYFYVDRYLYEDNKKKDKKKMVGLPVCNLYHSLT